MPNTLVHIGVQGLSNRLVSSRIDLKWVFLGCIIPDIPWVLRRALIALAPNINLYDVTLYTAVQASLLFCVLLSAAIALLSEKPRLVFVILAVNALFHLMLDTLEIKWGNGVFLMAPINWQFLSFDLVWPNSELIAFLTLVGLAIGIWALVHAKSRTINVKFNPPSRLIASIVLFLLYMISPMALTDGPLTANFLSISTLLISQ